MRTLSLIGHVEEAHALILGGGGPADLVFRDFFRARRYLGATDRRFVAETVYALLRHRFLVESVDVRLPAQIVALDARGKLPIARTDLLVSAAEAMATDPREVEAVARSARELQGPADPPAARIAFHHSLPAWLAARLVEEYGADEAERLAAALNEPAPMALRANTLLNRRDELLARLPGEGIAARPGATAPDALVLERRINVFSSPSFLAGRFEVQDEGSQMVSVTLDPRPGARILDACAGAGGKTLHLAALLRGKGEVFAYEPSARRREELRRRVRRSTAQNVRILDDAGAVGGGMDAVLVDAPCSGTGTLRRNPFLKSNLSPEDIARHAAEQLAILRQWAPFAKPGGLLAYVTCSLLREENEAVVEAFLRDGGYAPAAPSRVLLPHLHGTDGFFIALLRRLPAPGAPGVEDDG
ncbi:MAG: RsmB/NOP family class I SAM-dependent RNA methyltransferase [Planctomycetaceae bacterium]